MSLDHDFDWQRALLPQIKQILANYLIIEAPAHEDMRRNTDLIVLTMDRVRIACRLRRYNYLARYPNEFTIRSGRPSGVQTELQKVIAGWGDYIFYGFASPDGSELAAWMLGDLKEFRLWFNRELWRGCKPWTAKPNVDGSSDFLAFQIDDLPEQFVVARKRAQPLAVA